MYVNLEVKVNLPVMVALLKDTKGFNRKQQIEWTEWFV